MRKSLFILALIAFAFTACTKEKKEDTNPPLPDPPFTLAGKWVQYAPAGGWKDILMFNIGDSTYRKHGLPTATSNNVEQGHFHARAIGTDSLEVRLESETMIIQKIDYRNVFITRGDSTRKFIRQIMPG